MTHPGLAGVNSELKDFPEYTRSRKAGDKFQQSGDIRLVSCAWSGLVNVSAATVTISAQ